MSGSALRGSSSAERWRSWSRSAFRLESSAFLSSRFCEYPRQANSPLGPAIAWPAKVPTMINAAAGHIARRINPMLLAAPFILLKNQKDAMKASHFVDRFTEIFPKLSRGCRHAAPKRPDNALHRLILLRCGAAGYIWRYGRTGPGFRS